MRKIKTINKRKLNRRERAHNKAPNSNISIIATIIGNISPSTLRDTIRKMQIRLPILNSYLQMENSDVYLLGDEGMEIPLKVLPREGNTHWKEQIIKEQKTPLDLTKGPLIRFILLRSSEISDLIIFCQHTICDGMSLAYLARDIIEYLGNPSKEVETLPKPPIIDEDAIPDDIKPSLSLRLLGWIIRKKWEKAKVIIDFQDFRELHKVFWDKYTYKAELYEMSREDTKKFVEACREHDMTVNTTLIAAFAIAQNKVNPNSPEYLKKYASAVDLRNLITKDVGEQFGFFAGGIQFEYEHKEDYSLWDAARKIYEEANPENSRREALQGTVDNFKLPASLIESQFYAAFGHLIPPSSPSYDKIQAFINDEKNIAVKLVKKKISKGTLLAQIMTNLGKLDFPERYGDLVLKNLILMPSCSPYTELIPGVVTHGGTLSITLNHMESTISTEKVLRIREIVNDLIMKAIDE